MLYIWIISNWQSYQRFVQYLAFIVYVFCWSLLWELCTFFKGQPLECDVTSWVYLIVYSIYRISLNVTQRFNKRWTLYLTYLLLIYLFVCILSVCFFFCYILCIHYTPCLVIITFITLKGCHAHRVWCWPVYEPL